MMNRRREMLLKKSGGGGHNLPPEYQQVEYIRDLYIMGFINTELSITQNTGCEISFKIISASESGNYYLLGMFVANKCRFNPFFTSNTNLATCPQLSWTTSVISKLDNNKHIAAFNKTLGIIEYDGIVTPHSVKKFYAEGVSEPLLLFSRTGGNTSYAEVYMYNCKIYENEQIISDMIPCYRKIDGMIGVFDIVRNEFYAVNNNSYFDKGADV